MSFLNFSTSNLLPGCEDHLIDPVAYCFLPQSDTISQVDHPGEVVRITPKKGEVDYQGVHAKARPGTWKDHGEDEDEIDVDLENYIFRHHTIIGIFDQCSGH